MSSDETAEVVVVGAGFAGLSAAKSYIQCSPETNVVVLDSNRTIGGTWAQERLYHGLRSNNIRGSLEFPDYPFHDDLGIKEGEHVTGEAVHRYLTEYADHWSITHRIRFQSRVLSAQKVDEGIAGGWLLTVATPEAEYKLFTNKLIVATGLTSQPQTMHVKSQECYKNPIINTANLADAASEVGQDPSIKRVTVFGGSKTAWDAVYLFASLGKEVDWVIRKTGHGPTFMSIAHVKIGPLGKFKVESLVTRRILAWMSPCLWGGLDGSTWWRSLLHQTWLGRKFVEIFWSALSNDTLHQSGFDSHPKLQVLKPDSGLFETGKGLAILNYPTDALDYVRSGQVKVHRQDLSHMSEHAVHLRDGTRLKSDAFVFSTGWLPGPTVGFQPSSLHFELGIPSTDYSDQQTTFWEQLDREADIEIFKRWPSLATLKNPPRTESSFEEPQLDGENGSESQQNYQPLRLYRSLVPPRLAAKGDRSIAFAGLSANLTNHVRNEIAGLWIYAYMNDMLTVDPCRDVENIYWETALFNRFCFRRHPYGFGSRFPDFVFDSVPWNDLLLHDLGLSGLRKGGGFYRELFEPYAMADYRGITAEWLDKLKHHTDKKIS